LIVQSGIFTEPIIIDLNLLFDRAVDVCSFTGFRIDQQLQSLNRPLTIKPVDLQFETTPKANISYSDTPEALASDSSSMQFAENTNILHLNIKIGEEVIPVVTSRESSVLDLKVSLYQLIDFYMRWRKFQKNMICKSKTFYLTLGSSNKLYKSNMTFSTKWGILAKQILLNKKFKIQGVRFLLSFFQTGYT
jgi:hypothetical protein